MATMDMDLDWAGLLTQAARPSPWSHNSTDRIERSGGFTGTHTYADALTLLREGWKEGRDQIVEGLRATAPTTMRTTVRTLDVAGAYPIAAMAAAGDMQCMVAIGEDIAPRPTIRMVIGTSYMSDTPHSAIINRGVAVCRVLDAIEAAGTRVELISEWHNRCEHGPAVGQTFKASIIVKETHDPLEIDRVAFVFAHPSMNRRIGFRLRELTKPSDWMDSSYGVTQPLQAADYPDAIVLQPILPGQHSAYATPERAFQTVTANCRAAGIEID
jgi:hypothetical protein